MSKDDKNKTPDGTPKAGNNVIEINPLPKQEGPSPAKEEQVAVVTDTAEVVKVTLTENAMAGLAIVRSHLPKFSRREIGDEERAALVDRGTMRGHFFVTTAASVLVCGLIAALMLIAGAVAIDAPSKKGEMRHMWQQVTASFEEPALNSFQMQRVLLLADLAYPSPPEVAEYYSLLEVGMADGQPWAFNAYHLGMDARVEELYTASAAWTNWGQRKKIASWSTDMTGYGYPKGYVDAVMVRAGSVYAAMIVVAPVITPAVPSADNLAAMYSGSATAEALMQPSVPGEVHPLAVSILQQVANTPANATKAELIEKGMSPENADSLLAQLAVAEASAKS